MTEIFADAKGSGLIDGLSFLRTRALSAHAAGDGFAANHICRIAIRSLFLAPSEELVPVQVDLQNVRWVFSLWLYWLLGYELITEKVGSQSVRGLCDRLLRSAESEHDFSLLTIMFDFLGDPSSPFSVERAVQLPTEWFAQRASEPEDIALLPLAVEFAWASEKTFGGCWRRLIDNWLPKCPEDSALAISLQRLRRRLELQTSLCGDSYRHGQPENDLRNAHDAVAVFEQCWWAFLECEWERLDDLIKELSAKTRVDASEYLPLFNLLHASRPFRPVTDDQLISLSRRFYGMSRQPAQIFHNDRSHQNAMNALELRLQTNPNHGALDRWKGAVMTMLEQLASLRSWDLGSWHEAVERQSEYHLDLARFNNPEHAKRGIMCSVLALQNPTTGKDVWYDNALLLLDQLGEEDRSELVLWLLARRPLEWLAAHGVLAKLSDSIPEELLPALARWTVQIAITEKMLRGWSITYLGFWSKILPYAKGDRDFVGTLMPAILRDAARPLCWQEVTDSLIYSLRQLPLKDAQAVIGTLMDTNVPGDSDEALTRWGIISNACFRRAELFDAYRIWLLEQPFCDPPSAYVIRRLEKTRDWQFSPAELQMHPENDEEIRNWIRLEIRRYCDQVMPEAGRTSMVQMPFRPHCILYVTWPDEETELIESLVMAVDIPDVLVTAKIGPLRALGYLVLRLPSVTADRICNEALRWLHAGVTGREITFGGPHSIAQFQGPTHRATFTSVLFLADMVLCRAPSRVSDDIASLLLANGLRQPTGSECLIFRMMARLGLASDNAHSSLASISEAVVDRAVNDNPTDCVLTFLYLLAPLDGTTSVIAAAPPATRKLFLGLWKLRLRELATHRLPSVRKAVGVALNAWQRLVTQHPEWGNDDDLEATRVLLTKDARASVRHAAQQTSESVNASHIAT